MTHPGSTHKASSSLATVFRTLVDVGHHLTDDSGVDIAILQAYQTTHNFHNGIGRFVGEIDPLVGRFLKIALLAVITLSKVLIAHMNAGRGEASIVRYAKRPRQAPNYTAR